MIFKTNTNLKFIIFNLSFTIMKKHKIIIGITGASGSIYSKVLIDKLILLNDQVSDCGIVISDSGKKVWEYELGNNDYLNFPFKIYDKKDFFAPFASGSSEFDTMFVCPCSMGTLGRIASGVSDDLLTRAADVMLKERKKLILIVREMPYNLIHINNMKIVTEAGGIICPASPSFYSHPENISSAIETVIDKILKLSGFEFDSFSWNKS